MVSLASFNAQSTGDLVFSEKNARLCTLPVSLAAQENSNSVNYPTISLGREIFHNSRIPSTDSRSFMNDAPSAEPLLKRFSRTFFESGLSLALDELIQTDSKVLGAVSKLLLYVIDSGNRLRSFYNPYLRVKGIVSIEKYSRTRDWSRSTIRCLAFHPNVFKLAVAASDDTIRIYGQAIVPILKCSHQKSITCMAFRPFTTGELAVGCSTGVLIWTLDPNSLISRPLNQPTLLKNENHSPVTSISWSPSGSLLASCSTSDTDLLIWDVDLHIFQPLKRVKLPCALLIWSPNNNFICSSTVSNVFRVWNVNRNWHPDGWSLNTGNCIQDFAFSPCSRYLLFITSNDNFLYCLSFIDEKLFNKNNLSAQQSALPIADLSKVVIQGLEFGGRAQSVAWSANGNQLAISFKDCSSIAIFNIKIQKHVLNISPSFFLAGVGSEYPCNITFQPSYEKNDSVLAIGWSSGRVQFFPFV